MSDLSKSRFKKLLVIFYNRPADIFTLDKLLRFPTLKTASRKTISRYLIKGCKASLIEKVHLSQDQSGYRARDPDRLRAYINGQTMTDWTKLPLKPERPFLVMDRHRVTYSITLTESELAVVRQNGNFRPNDRTGGSITLTKREFTLVVNARSGRGQAWLRLGWDIALSRLLGSRLQADLSRQVEAQIGHRHISLPVEVANQRIALGGSSMLIAGSHYPMEIDLQGLENDDLAVKALEMATDSIKFNRAILDIVDNLSFLKHSQKSTESAIIALAEGFKSFASCQSDLNNRLSALLEKFSPPKSNSSEIPSKPGGELIGYG